MGLSISHTEQWISSRLNGRPCRKKNRVESNWRGYLLYASDLCMYAYTSTHIQTCLHMQRTTHTLAPWTNVSKKYLLGTGFIFGYEDPPMWAALFPRQQILNSMIDRRMLAENNQARIHVSFFSTLDCGYASSSRLDYLSITCCNLELSAK